MRLHIDSHFLVQDFHDRSHENSIEKSDTDLMKDILNEGDYNGQILPLRSVGVQGDCRSYKNLSVMYGKGLDFDWELVSKKAKEITDKIHTVNRVAYILNEK